jgi:hypothetical protein
MSRMQSSDSLAVFRCCGAFLGGVVGAKWITNEADKRLLRESVSVAATKNIPADRVPEILSGSPLQVLENVSSV